MWNGYRKTMFVGLLAYLLVWSVACVPSSRIERHTIRQSALVPAPSGPATDGPMPKGGNVGVESDFTASATRSGGERSQGASGNILLDRNLGLKIVGGATDWLEITGGVTGGHAAFSTPTANDLDEDAFGSTTSVWLNNDVRFRLLRTEALDLHASVGGRAAFVPYRRKVRTDTATNYNDSRYDDPWLPEQDRRYDWTSVEAEQKNKLLVLPQSGLGSVIRFGDAVSLSTGGYVQQVPTFFGQKTTVEYCENPTGMVGDETCSGQSPDDVNAVQRNWLGTVYGGLQLSLDQTMFRFQAFYNVAGDSRWTESSPGGLTLAVRRMF